MQWHAAHSTHHRWFETFAVGDATDDDKDSNQPIAGKSPDKQNVTVFVLDQEKAILLQRKTCDTKL